MPVRFSVDALPGETFTGEVSKVRLNASMTQNVVTYTVVVSTDNSSGKLLPYLTANVQFEIGRRENVLEVPNAALRWWPESRQIAAAASGAGGGAGGGRRGGRPNAGAGNGADQASTHGTLWIPVGNLVRPVQVQTGLTDGTMTEVQGQELAEGMAVVVGEQQASTQSTGNGNVNPFTPQLGRARRGS